MPNVIKQIGPGSLALTTKARKVEWSMIFFSNGDGKNHLHLVKKDCPIKVEKGIKFSTAHGYKTAKFTLTGPRNTIVERAMQLLATKRATKKRVFAYRIYRTKSTPEGSRVVILYYFAQ